MSEANTERLKAIILCKRSAGLWEADKESTVKKLWMGCNKYIVLYISMVLWACKLWGQLQGNAECCFIQDLDTNKQISARVSLLKEVLSKCNVIFLSQPGCSERKYYLKLQVISGVVELPWKVTQDLLAIYFDE